MASQRSRTVNTRRSQAALIIVQFSSVCAVPLVPGANQFSKSMDILSRRWSLQCYEGLPAKLRMELTKRKQAETKYACMCRMSQLLLLLHFLAALYKRLDADHVFATALTTVAPNNKGGTVLHPSVSALPVGKSRQVIQRLLAKTDSQRSGMCSSARIPRPL